MSIFRRAWFWAAALGVAMIAGGAATLVLGLTRVLLPYDEHFLGVTAEVLQRTSPRLFDFMAHDRATLAGTMLGLGWLYLLVGREGVRRQRHGARAVIIASAITGFASFFSFFGFGYFDTLHAFVAVILFQLSVQIMVSEEGGAPADPEQLEIEDEAWRRAHWGQLLWIVHAAGLLIAGGVILTIGMTSVFVREDITFLCMSDEAVRALDARLFAVVAHDRATLGGMLLASGVGSLLLVLWCFQRAAAWLWTAMAGLGVPAYAAALGVHLWVGYTDWRHLVPAGAGLLLWLGGLWCSRAYLRG
jgi:dihydroorotate dehydrogenase